jgi:hypothetical protein
VETKVKFAFSVQTVSNFILSLCYRSKANRLDALSDNRGERKMEKEKNFVQTTIIL